MRIPGLKRVFVTEEELQKRVSELGMQIEKDYAGKHPVLVSILKGSFYFLSDLTRKIDIPLNIDFMAIGVYPGSQNHTGVVRISKDLDINIAGRHVLIVEDIINTGLTLGYLVQQMEARKPASIKICTLLDNPALRLVDIPVAYTGFNMPDIYLAGYGLDINEELRHLPYIVEVDETVKSF